MSTGSRFEHGTVSGYRNHGCGCEPCRAAHRRAVKAWRVRSRADHNGVPSIRTTVDAAPVVAHLQRLAASGYTLREVSRETGVHRATVQRIAAGHRNRVHASVAVQLLALGPLPQAANLIDSVVVDRLIDAFPDRIWDSMGATRLERIAAAELLDARGRSLRPHLKGRGFGDQQVLAPARNEIERCLSLRCGRDFAVRQDVAS